jgi:carboxylesterase
MTLSLIPGGEPFFLPGGEAAGVVLTHGLTSSPGEMRWLGDYLAAQGCTVYGVRLAGHATDPRDLARVHWRDWLADVHDGFHLLRARCRRVALVGHSLGGVLTLAAACDLPVDAAVVLGSPIRPTARLMQAAHWLRWVLPYTDQPDRSDLPAIVRAEQARRGEPVRGRIRYDRWASNGVAQLNETMAQVRARLGEVRAPLLLIYARHDQTVPLEHMAWIAARVASPTVMQRVLERGGHNLQIDVDRDQAFAWIGEFLHTHLLAAPAATGG